jgi:hypothetical protein
MTFDEPRSVPAPPESPASPTHEPVHPHPLSNDLIDDALPPRTPNEVRAETALGPAPRRVVRVLAAIVAVFALLAFVCGFLVWPDRPLLVLAWSGVALLFFVGVSAPILLAAATKEAADEEVRDARTSSRVLHLRQERHVSSSGRAG